MEFKHQEGITNARELGTGKFAILGIQHLFAMFGATILVPALTGLSVSTTLLFAGIGTLLFHIISKMQVPAFLGSSFAFIGGYLSVKQLGMEQGMSVNDAAWIGLPFSRETSVLAVADDFNASFMLSSVIAIVPIAFATIMEHIGDMCAISSTVGKDFLAKPGLHRTLIDDGLATALASIFGAPANTTYGENTGVLNLTRVFDPAVIRLAAIFSIILSFCPKFACIIGLMPAATIGGVSLILYGMISSVGVRNLVESAVDLSSSRNVFVAALILVLAIGVKYGANDSVAIGSIHLSGLAIAALVGIILNAVLPEQLGMKVKSFNGKEKKHQEYTEQ